MTKRQHLRHELSEQRQELDHALVVLRVLQAGSDEEAAQSLARLRLGHSVEQEYHYLQSQSQYQDVDAEAESVESSVASPSLDRSRYSRSTSKDGTSQATPESADSLPAMPSLPMSQSEDEISQQSHHPAVPRGPPDDSVEFALSKHHLHNARYNQQHNARLSSSDQSSGQLPYLPPGYETRPPVPEMGRATYGRRSVPSQWPPGAAVASPSVDVQHTQQHRHDAIPQWSMNRPVAWSNRPYDAHNIDPSLLGNG